MKFYSTDPKDHVDIFLDELKMEHNIDLRKRLMIEDSTISVSDILLTKLQIFEINEKDLRDILSVVKDLQLGEEDKSGTINLKYISDFCSKDWGLYQDTISNAEKCMTLIPRYNLTPEEVKRIKEKMVKIKERIVHTKKLYDGN